MCGGDSDLQRTRSGICSDTPPATHTARPAGRHHQDNHRSGHTRGSPRTLYRREDRNRSEDRVFHTANPPDPRRSLRSGDRPSDITEESLMLDDFMSDILVSPVNY